jgi:hypothetical protein
MIPKCQLKKTGISGHQEALAVMIIVMMMMMMATNVALKMEAVFGPLSPHQTACAVCVTVATMVTVTTVLRLGSG